MNPTNVPDKIVEEVLDLYFCCPNNSLKIIASIVSFSEPTISRIVNAAMTGEIKYQKPNNLLILHSSINTDTP